MAGALSVVGSSVVDSGSCPFRSPSSISFRSSSGETVALQRNSPAKRVSRRRGTVDLSSSFVPSWEDGPLVAAKSRPGTLGPSSKKPRRARRCSLIVNELAGQYEDSFADVKTQILNYFTHKAVRTVLNQLYEMNPTQYRWFYDFLVTNKPGDGKQFIRTLGKEKHELAERVMITRLHLYAKWIKKCDHAEMYQYISNQNLELMRERLMETVVWPSDDSNTEKIG